MDNHRQTEHLVEVVGQFSMSVIAGVGAMLEHKHNSGSEEEFVKLLNIGYDAMQASLKTSIKALEDQNTTG